MKIAICDDEQLFLDRIKESIEDFLHNNNVMYEIDTFTSGVEFLALGLDVSSYDIVFLDINMGEISGLEIARKIRELSKKVYLVFVTAFIDYSIEGYKVNAIRYLLKNNVNMEKAIEECLIAIMDNMEDSLGVLTLDCIEGKKAIPIDRLIYIESKLHRLKFHVLEDRVNVYNKYETLTDVEQRIEKKSFYRVHQSYLVNFKYVSQVKRYEMVLLDQTKIPIPKAKFKEVSEAFTQYKGEFYV